MARTGVAPLPCTKPQSLEAPDDPVLSFMRDRGLVAPLRFCGNRSLVPDAWSRERLDLWWGPLWMSDRAEDVAAGLVNVTALAPAQHAAQVGLEGRSHTCETRCGSLSSRP